MNTNKGTIGAILVVAGCILLAQPSMAHPIFVYAILLNITGILLVIARLLPGLIGKARTFSNRVKDEIKRQNS
jgi:hypothetical protein